jgi:hypothetical protein
LHILGDNIDDDKDNDDNDDYDNDDDDDDNNEDNVDDNDDDVRIDGERGAATRDRIISSSSDRPTTMNESVFSSFRFGW